MICVSIMKIEITVINNISLAEVIGEGLLINCLQDALDILGETAFSGISKVILHEKNITADFFDLKTGLAGEILQKFSTYQVQLAIVGDFSKYSSKSLKDFIFESNKHGRINFVNCVDEAQARLIRT
jgi:hypothetical protein